MDRSYFSAGPPAARPRVCVLFPHLILGGGETAMMEVAEGRRERFDLAVCALARRAKTVELSAAPELLERFPGASFVREQGELAAALASADVVLWYGMAPLIPMTLESMERRPASVRVVHTSKEEEGVHFHARWRHAIDAVVCVSPAMARGIAGAVFIPNTCSPGRLAGPRRDFFPGSGRKTLGFLGRLFSFKNVDWLIAHAAELDCNLLIQGIDTGELTRAGLEEAARAAGVGERVRFLEPSPDAGTLLKSLDAVAIVSRQEGFPMVAVEAGMVGTPIVATRVGALPELFAEEILFIDFEGESGRPSVPSLRRALAAAGPAHGRVVQAKVGRLCARESVVERYAAL